MHHNLGLFFAGDKRAFVAPIANDARSGLFERDQGSQERILLGAHQADLHSLLENPSPTHKIGSMGMLKGLEQVRT